MENDRVNKKTLVDEAIGLLKEEIAKIQSSIDSERESLNDSPNAMQSWSDTTRSQKEGLVFGMEQLLAKKREMLRGLQSMRIEPHTTVQVGSFVTLVEEGKRKYYIILPGIIGESFEKDDMTIEIISPVSIVARSLKGHRKGEDVQVKVPAGLRELHVEDVQ
jgi:transcription elongation GreA/GreB family factor